jgi:hypothetical protein
MVPRKVYNGSQLYKFIKIRRTNLQVNSVDPITQGVRVKFLGIYPKSGLALSLLETLCEGARGTPGREESGTKTKE